MVKKSIIRIAKEYNVNLSYTQLKYLENAEKSYISGNIHKWDCLELFKFYLDLFTNGNQDKTRNIVNEWNWKN